MCGGTLKMAKRGKNGPLFKTFVPLGTIPLVVEFFPENAFANSGVFFSYFQQEVFFRNVAKRVFFFV